MEEIKLLQKKYCSGAIITALIAGVAFIIFGFRPFGKGLILGTLFSILNFILLNLMIPMKLGITQTKLFILTIGSVSFRYIILSIPLILSIKLKEFNFIAVILGILSIQIIIFIDNLFSQPLKKQA